MKIAWSYTPKSHYGALTSMISDSRHTWVVTGTHRGVISFWDTRFRLCTNTWQHPSKAGIHDLALYPTSSAVGNSLNTPKHICMSLNNEIGEVSVWDLQSQECQQMWCTFKPDVPVFEKLTLLNLHV